MKYTNYPEEKPRNNVDVHVVTTEGVRGVARYWEDVGVWLTGDSRLKVTDKIKKWKYENAITEYIK